MFPVSAKSFFPSQGNMSYVVLGYAGHVLTQEDIEK